MDNDYTCKLFAQFTRLLALLWLGIAPNLFAQSNECIQTYTKDRHIHIAKINLACKNLRLIGTEPQDKGLTVSDFAHKYQADVAINANFFKKDLTPLGLTITDSKRWANTRDTKSKLLFACNAQNQCGFEAQNRTSKIDPKWTVAVSGWQFFDQKTGKFACAVNDKIGCHHDIFSGKHPRTMLGLDETQNLLYFVVVDGRLLSFRGFTLDELANLATELGLTKAVNLDGGGSSTMVVNHKRLSNLPLFQAGERKVGNHFGVKIIN